MSFSQRHSEEPNSPTILAASSVDADAAVPEDVLASHPGKYVADFAALLQDPFFPQHSDS
jgi:hypothetical protein